MANDLTTNPMVLDTVGATSVRTEHLKIKGIRWVGATTAAHQCILHDNDGIVVWESIASGGNYVDAMVIEIGVNGIDLDTLDSGVLYIYLE